MPFTDCGVYFRIDERGKVWYGCGFVPMGDETPNEVAEC